MIKAALELYYSERIMSVLERTQAHVILAWRLMRGLAIILQFGNICYVF